MMEMQGCVAAYCTYRCRRVQKMPLMPLVVKRHPWHTLRILEAIVVAGVNGYT